jgi:hypothetical protein
MSRRTLTTIATALTLVAAGIAATAWLTSAKESTRVTTATTANATTNANANSDANASQPVAASPSSQAQTAVVATATATTAATAAQATTHQPSAPSAAGQRAFIDPTTGQLRQPEHEELAAIAAQAAVAAPAGRLAARTASASSQTFGDDGSVSATVPEELHTFTVATRGPDGRIVIEHAQGAANATRMVKANSAKTTPQASVSRAQQKEDRHDR